MENLVRHQDETIPHGEGNAEQITEQIRSKITNLTIKTKISN